ncbi:MAG: DUF2085 domain-containing protein [Anaerolineae bacterium]
MQTLVRAINRALLFFTGHWLALINGFMALVLGLALLAPWLALRGQAGLSDVLYWAYQPLCHQLPERSFFIGGPRAVYTLEQLAASLGHIPAQRFTGNAQLGYKIAFCQRDVATYGGWLVFGLVFALGRKRIRPLPWPWVIALMVPMAVDGLLQLFGIMASNPERRVITGLLFALGTAWFAYPHVQKGMVEAQAIARQSLESVSHADS